MLFSVAMKKAPKKTLPRSSTADASCALLLAFYRALDEYCDEIGVAHRRFSAVRILRNAACNTFMQTREATPEYRRHMATMQRKIPELFTGLIAISCTRGYLHNVDLMSEMSLAQIAAQINLNSHKR